MIMSTLKSVMDVLVRELVDSPEEAQRKIHLVEYERRLAAERAEAELQARHETAMANWKRFLERA